MANTGPSDVPYAEEWLAFEAVTGGRTVLKGDIFAMREQFNGLTAAMASMAPPPDDSITTSEHKTADGVAVRAYKPKDAAPGLPIGLYIHSGGWCFGSVDAEDALARQVARSVPCILVSPEYRLAPENPFPAALEDTSSTYRWMATSAESLGGDVNKLFTIGGSAGGNLALTTALKVLDEKSSSGTLKGIFALCPGTMLPQAISSLPEDLRPFSNPDAYQDAAMIDVEVVESCSGKQRNATLTFSRSRAYL
jgi:versiconal hemiacetal acetate esterase